MSGSCSLHLLDERLGRDVDAEVVDGEAGALEHDVAEVLADVVHVALDRAHDERADRPRPSRRAAAAGCRARPASRARRSASRGRRSRRARSARRPPRATGSARRRASSRAEPSSSPWLTSPAPRARCRRACCRRGPGGSRRASCGTSLPCRGGRAGPRAAACSSSGRELLDPRRRRRSVGPEIESAARHVPSAPRTGAASAESPSSSSSTAVAYARASRMSARASAARRAWSSAARRAPKARKTLPFAVSGSGTRRPTQFVDADEVPRVALGEVLDAGGRRDGEVDRLAGRVGEPASASSASSTRSTSGTPRCAKRNSTGPGRRPPRPPTRWTSPCRSSAPTRREVVDFGSPVPSASSPTASGRAVSTTRTSSCAARSIACVPAMAHIVEHLFHDVKRERRYGVRPC